MEALREARKANYLGVVNTDSANPRRGERGRFCWRKSKSLHPHWAPVMFSECSHKCELLEPIIVSIYANIPSASSSHFTRLLSRFRFVWGQKVCISPHSTAHGMQTYSWFCWQRQSEVGQRSSAGQQAPAHKLMTYYTRYSMQRVYTVCQTCETLMFLLLFCVI